ncbi:telomerase Cajal body protein 1-like [Dendronephthya gigantea]|uniref:telomerase Cajal body protein 1-like n=1 Tax=Dendronephthya gigantea TaxID=151771 RepID=UPI00106AC953|nr:telomerase Cajal body protein 1-like [Dendronephthya gigantea]
MDVKILNPLEVLAEDNKLCCEGSEGTEKTTANGMSNQNINNSDSLPVLNETELLQFKESQILCQPPGGSTDNDCGETSEYSNTKCSETELQTRNIPYSGPFENNNPEESEVTNTLLRYEINFSTPPVQITGAWRDFEGSPENFLKGCKWSPDGTCILTCSNDNTLRLFNLPTEMYSGFFSLDVLPEMSSVLQMKEGETIYDYAWYPKMSSYDPDTCCFISSSREHPLHLWDAFTGQVRCSYRSFNNMDEIVSPHCVAFNSDGSKIYCGFDKMVRVFDTSRPGRQCQQRRTVSKKQGQFGIISCIAASPENNGLYACGSFSKSVGLYNEPKGDLMSLVEGHQGGVTHLAFSHDGQRLYSGGRKDNEIICWDMRYPGAILHKLSRFVKTNQRMYFDIDSSGKYVISGNHDGTVSVWDTYVSSDVILPCGMTYIAHDDCTNGVSFHPSLPLLATASGQRKFVIKDEFENGENEDEQTRCDCSLRLWKLSCNSQTSMD